METENNYSLEVLEPGSSENPSQIVQPPVIGEIEVKDIKYEGSLLLVTVEAKFDYWGKNFFRMQLFLFRGDALMRLKKDGKAVSRHEALRPVKMTEVGDELYEISFSMLDYPSILKCRLENIIQQCTDAGFVATIEHAPLKPLASGHYEHVVNVRPARINSQYD